VYVEEVSFRSKSIEGVGTSTTAFAGATASGPVGGSPELLTSFADYERIYGGLENLTFTGKSAPTLNYLAHAARAYFDNGGARLYVARVFGGDTNAILAGRANTKAAPFLQDKDTDPTKFGYFRARFPGQWMNGAQVIAQLVAMPVGGTDFLKKQPDGTVLRIISGTGDDAKFVIWFKSNGKFQRLKDDNSAEDVPANDQTGDIKAEALSVNISVVRDGVVLAEYPGVSSHSASPRALGQILSADPKNRADQLTQPIAVVMEDGIPTDPARVLTGLVGAQPAVKNKQAGDEPSKTFTFAGGNDGNEPAGANYETADQIAAGFDLLIGLEDVSIVAAPGYSDYGDAQNIQDKLIGHTEKPRRYRIAVLDSPKNQTPSQMRTERGKIDSTRAALYYPWIVASNPLWTPSNSEPREIVLPPSGSVCGIYARNDIQRGVFKAPANEIVRGALRFERDVNFAEQELLNPLGVNCLRYLSGRGYRVWGARTVSSDPEWKYVSVRRYFNYLEASIDRGTQWVVFEPNGELLWANVRGTISDFLLAEWKTGALLGTKPEEAFFVRCDRSTMTQNDLDNGRLICLIGVAVVKPAEFVIFRIGQKTADAKS
jgi:phage tail sheath protein FI